MRHGYKVDFYDNHYVVTDRRLNVELVRFETRGEVDDWLHKYAECGLKRRFASKHAADRSKKQILRSGGPPMRKYLCRQCDGYHLTKRLAPPVGQESLANTAA